MIRMSGVSIAAIRIMASRVRLRREVSIATDTETASVFGAAISRAARVVRSRPTGVTRNEKGLCT